ncbi:penicillin-binding protein activator [Magnetospira thiophila]
MIQRKVFAAWAAALLLMGTTACQSPLLPVPTQVAQPDPQQPAPPLPAEPAAEAVPVWKNPPSRWAVHHRSTQAYQNQEAGLAPQPTPRVAPAPMTGSEPLFTDTRGVARVAVLLPLSGRHARLGKSLRNAAQLALFEFAGQSFELMFMDTGGTTEGAREAALTAISDGAALILGPLLSESTKAAGAVARQANVPLVSFSSDAGAASPGAYVLGFRPETEVRRVISYAVNAGLRRFAVLAPHNNYGDRVVAEFRSVVADLGGTVSRVARYGTDSATYNDVIRDLADFDYRHQALLAQKAMLEKRSDEVSKMTLSRLENLQTIGDPDFDALLVADGGRRLQEVAALLPYYDVDPKVVKMLGTGQWDVPGIGVEPALVGGWFAASDPALRQGLMTRYQETFGEEPPRLITLAYDATALAAVLVRGAQDGPDYSAPTLTQSTGFLGTDGVFRLKPNGLGERGLAILEVHERTNVILDPAPQSFEEPLN